LYASAGTMCSHTQSTMRVVGRDHSGAAIASAGPKSTTTHAYHVTGPSSAADYVGRACLELLMRTDDVLAGFSIAFAPPAHLCQRVLAQQFPAVASADDEPDPWRRLLAATGRPPH
jgi:hypothetical protein